MDKIQNYVIDSKRIGYKPVIVFDEVEYMPNNFGKLFLEFINGHQFDSGKNVITFNDVIFILILNPYLIPATKLSEQDESSKMDSYLTSEEILKMQYDKKLSSGKIRNTIYYMSSVYIGSLISNHLINSSRIFMDKCNIIPFSPHNEKSLEKIFVYHFYDFYDKKKYIFNLGKINS